MRPASVRSIAWLVAVAFVLPAAHAQSAAEKQLARAPFRIVSPFPASGPVDTLARILSIGLQAKYKQSAIVDNRVGANGNIGIDQVKRAAPDGHTLLVVPAGNAGCFPTCDFQPVRERIRERVRQGGQ